MSKSVIMTGATGFIGRSISPFFMKKGYDIIALSRNPSKYKEMQNNSFKLVSWDGQSCEGWLRYVDDTEVIVNLAGESIASGVWTTDRKNILIKSRVNSIQAILRAVSRASRKPNVLIQASAIGYYGSQGDQKLDESSPPGEGFLAQLTKEWENIAREIEKLGVRLVLLRFGVVLGRSGGILSRVNIPFRLFLGGHFGNGKQWISWIHISDILKATDFILMRPELSGVFNLTSPFPVKSREFFRAVGKSMNRPSWFHIPSAVLKLFIGEMAEEVFLTSQHVSPQKLLDKGFQYDYPKINDALADIYG